MGRTRLLLHAIDERATLWFRSKWPERDWDMRHVTGLIALAVVLGCAGLASSQQIPLLAGPPTTVDWGAYTVTKGAQSKVRQYLDSIDQLAAILQAPNKSAISNATNALRQKIYDHHKAEDGWARVMLAHRFAARGEWAGCLADLTSPAPTDTHPPNWLDSNGTPHGKTVTELLDAIKAKNQARQGAANPTRAEVDASINQRRNGPNRDHELNEGWNRILIAFSMANAAAPTDNAAWKRVQDELDHLEPPN